MQYRDIARTGARVSQYALGGGVFGSLAGEKEGIRIIHKALDAGINLVDTSNRYGDGESERIIGEAIRGKRDDIILATKFGAESDSAQNQVGASRRRVRLAVEKSLQRLQTDYIDIYQLHRPFGDVAFEEILGVLSDLVQEGKINYIGTSNHQAWQLAEAQAISGRHHLQRFVSEQAPYSILNRSIEMDITEVARRHDLGLLTYSPLAGGLLTGKYVSGREQESGSRAALFKGPAARMLDPELPDNAQKFAVIEQLQQAAVQAGMTLAHMSIAFARSHPAVTSIIIGPRTSEQLDQYLSGADVELSSDLLDAIDAIVPPGSRMEDQSPAWTPEWLDASRRRRI